MAQNQKAYKEALVTIFRFFVIISILGAAVTALASPWIIKLLYGPQYQSSAAILSTHVFVNVFVFQGMAQYLWVINNNVRAVTMFGTFMSAIIGIIANAILIRKFGVMGAPYSALLTECVSVVVIPCLLRRDLFDLYKRAFIPCKGYS
jgi:O-antigen/teichoic acid export membrane protein